MTTHQVRPKPLDKIAPKTLKRKRIMITEPSFVTCNT